PALWRRLGKADENVLAEMFFAEVLDLLAFDDLDAAVAGREGVTVLADPGGGHHDALGRVLVFHHPGKGADGLDADRAAVSLGLDDAQAAENRILVGRHRIDAVVLRRLGSPGFHAHRLEELPNKVLELGWRHVEEVASAVEAGDSVHAID